MENKHLSFAYDLLLDYPIVGRIQPVIALGNAIKDLGKIDDYNYEEFRYLQLEMIVKQCELLSDIAGYINATEKFSPNTPGTDIEANFMKVYTSLTSSTGSQIHDFFKSIPSKDDKFFYKIMGYDLLDVLLPTYRSLVSDDELNNSINVVKSVFERMVVFYEHFWDIYNAYKHGYRLFVNKAKCRVECHGEISGNLDLLITDCITYVDNNKNVQVVGFSRNDAAYKFSPFYVLQAIISAFNIRLLTSFGGFYGYDLSDIKSPSIWVFKRIGEYRKIQLSIEFQNGDNKVKW